LLTIGGAVRGQHAIATGLASVSVRAVAIDPQTPSILCAVIPDSGVYKSTDGGATWEARLRTEWLFSPAPTLEAFALDPQQPSTLYVGALYVCCGTVGITIVTQSIGGFTVTPTNVPRTLSVHDVVRVANELMVSLFKFVLKGCGHVPNRGYLNPRFMLKKEPNAVLAAEATFQSRGRDSHRCGGDDDTEDR
jgi:hypothetical protein